MQKKVKKLDSKKIKSEIEDLKKAFLNLKFQKATGQLEKTSEQKHRAIKYQKYYTGGSIVLMFLVLVAMYLVLN